MGHLNARLKVSVPSRGNRVIDFACPSFLQMAATLFPSPLGEIGLSMRVFVDQMEPIINGFPSPLGEIGLSICYGAS